MKPRAALGERKGGAPIDSSGQAALMMEQCDGFAESIASQRLGKHPATDEHETIEGRSSLGHARNMRTQH
jgi:hypothetical protein